MRHVVVDRTMLALLIASMLGTGLLTGCGRQRTVGPAGAVGELPDQEVSDFAVIETEEGRPQWKLYARYAATYTARNLVTARTLRVDFFDDQGKRSSILTARSGDLNQHTHNMTARGNVVLQTTEGTRLSTEELRFLNRENRIVVPVEQLVRIERGQDVLTGYGFESDPGLNHYEFKRAVKATVRSHDIATPEGGGR